MNTRLADLVCEVFKKKRVLEENGDIDEAEYRYEIAASELEREIKNLAREAHFDEGD